jgi:hypothetical protein
VERFAISFIKPEVPKFRTGNICITPNLQSRISFEQILTALERHMLGDWGILDDEDKAANESALKHGGRLLSAYYLLPEERKFWVITEADRSCTTFLFPEDY